MQLPSVRICQVMGGWVPLVLRGERRPWVVAVGVVAEEPAMDGAAAVAVALLVLHI